MSAENQCFSFKLFIFVPLGLCSWRWLHHSPHPLAMPLMEVHCSVLYYYYYYY